MKSREYICQLSLEEEGSQFEPGDGESSHRFQEKITCSPELDSYLTDSKYFYLSHCVKVVSALFLRIFLTEKYAWCHLGGSYMVVAWYIIRDIMYLISNHCHPLLLRPEAYENGTWNFWCVGGIGDETWISWGEK